MQQSDATGSDRAPSDGVISARLAELLDDMLSARAPNAGRFCGNCYHPLGAERMACPHCGIATSERAPVDAVPGDIIEAHRIRRSREGTVVRTFAWVGLTAGVVAALLPLILAGVGPWTLIAFFVLMVLFYIAAANLANSIGDAIGYSWGQAVFRKRWERHLAARDAATR